MERRVGERGVAGSGDIGIVGAAWYHRALADGKNRQRVQEQPRKPKQQPEPPAGKVLVAFRPED